MEKSPLLFASNSGLVNSRSYNVWKSSTVFHCHLFFTGIQVFKLFVRGDKQNPIGFKGERTLRGKMIQNVGSNCGQPIMTKITWSTAEMGTNWIMNVYLESSFHDLHVLFSLQWKLSHFGNGVLFHSLTLARCLFLVCCLVTWKPNKLIVLWSSVFWWFFYAFVCFLMIPFSPLLSISVPLLQTSGNEGFLAFLKQHTKLDIQVGMFAPLRTKTWKVIRLPPSVNIFKISRST